jgi:hypothetical protein
MLKDGTFSMFPEKFVKDAISTYTKNHGQAPKYLVCSPEDLADWAITTWGGKIREEILGLKIVSGHYLEAGQIDLALDIKEST